MTTKNNQEAKMSNFIPNSFMVPNAFVDEALSKLNGNACKIYLLIVRKTRGWNKPADFISFSQIRKFTGISSNETITKALNKLIEFKLVLVKSGNQKTSNEYYINDFGITENVKGNELSITENVIAITENVTQPITETVNTKTTIKTTNKKQVGACEKTLNIKFDDFWNLYDKKVGDKEKIEKKWATLKDAERLAVIEHLPKYKLAQPNKKYRKDPGTYLGNKSWNDEVIFDDNSPVPATAELPNTSAPVAQEALVGVSPFARRLGAKA